MTGHALTVAGFAIGDKLDITNLAAAGATLSFNITTHELTITKAATTINLQFDSAFAGEHFVLSADGQGGTIVHLQSGAGAALEASGHDVMNFVGAEHRALMINQSTAMFATHGVGSGVTLYTDPGLGALSAHGASVNTLIDHGLAHPSVMLR